MNIDLNVSDSESWEREGAELTAHIVSRISQTLASKGAFRKEPGVTLLSPLNRRRPAAVRVMNETFMSTCCSLVQRGYASWKHLVSRMDLFYDPRNDVCSIVMVLMDAEQGCVLLLPLYDEAINGQASSATNYDASLQLGSSDATLSFAHLFQILDQEMSAAGTSDPFNIDLFSSIPVHLVPNFSQSMWTMRSNDATNRTVNYLLYPGAIVGCSGNHHDAFFEVLSVYQPFVGPVIGASHSDLGSQQAAKDPSVRPSTQPISEPGMPDDDAHLSSDEAEATILCFSGPLLGNPSDGSAPRGLLGRDADFARQVKDTISLIERAVESCDADLIVIVGPISECQPSISFSDYARERLNLEKLARTDRLRAAGLTQMSPVSYALDLFLKDLNTSLVRSKTHCVLLPGRSCVFARDPFYPQLPYVDHSSVNGRPRYSNMTFLPNPCVFSYKGVVFAAGDQKWYTVKFSESQALKGSAIVRDDGKAMSGDSGVFGNQSPSLELKSTAAAPAGTNPSDNVPASVQEPHNTPLKTPFKKSPFKTSAGATAVTPEAAGLSASQEAHTGRVLPDTAARGPFASYSMKQSTDASDCLRNNALKNMYTNTVCSDVLDASLAQRLHSLSCNGAFTQSRLEKYTFACLHSLSFCPEYPCDKAVLWGRLWMAQISIEVAEAISVVLMPEKIATIPSTVPMGGASRLIINSGSMRPLFENASEPRPAEVCCTKIQIDSKQGSNATSLRAEMVLLYE